MPITALDGTTLINQDYTLSQGVTGLNAGGCNQNYSTTISWVYGNGAGQLTEIYAAQRTLLPSASETLDLIGTLVNPWFGETIIFAIIREIIFELLGGIANQASSITIGNPAGLTNPFPWKLGGTNPTITIFPSNYDAGSKADAVGWAVSGAARNIRVTNNDASNSAVYRVTIKGST